MGRLDGWRALIPRWIARDIVHPSSEGEEAEARARVALGDLVPHGFPQELGLS
jgi:hypothetical protein